MSGWTKGPWRVEEGTDLVWGACDPEDRSTYGMGYPIMRGVAPQSLRHSHPTPEEREANARVAAASPSLAEALAEALAYLEGSNPMETSGGHKNATLREAIRAALSAARGEGVRDE